MKKIITALGNPLLNDKLKEEEDLKILTKDIQYQDGIFESLDITASVYPYSFKVSSIMS